MKVLFIIVNVLWQLLTGIPQLEEGKFFVFTQEANFYIVTPEGFYKTIDGKQWEFLKQEVAFEEYTYKTLEINGMPHIISAGLGEVYQFKNDSIVRVDNSFDFRAFHGSNLFAYNNEIHSFGGYGLFTYKNTLLRFSSKASEWFQVHDNK